MATASKKTIEELKAAAQAAKKAQPDIAPREQPGEAEKAAFVNKIEISGYLGRDVEFQVTPNGFALGKASMGVSQYAGKGKEAPTMWLELTMWEPNEKTPGDLKENQELFLDWCQQTKGTKIVAQGLLEMREWMGKDGAKHQTWGIKLTNF